MDECTIRAVARKGRKGLPDLFLNIEGYIDMITGKHPIGREVARKALPGARHGFASKYPLHWKDYKVVIGPKEELQ